MSYSAISDASRETVSFKATWAGVKAHFEKAANGDRVEKALPTVSLQYKPILGAHRVVYH
ncbi:hypothetical protein [Salinimonas chungwhensis]|uniref:hypothetical protein n=1 Tax=Salinimonas chungwhensis TaxID=265425 RepID=UPI00035F9878|nr:hypothetical protein [Salinimonas chungwhensis]